MTTALSVDLRKRVVAAVDGGLSRRQAAARFGVSISSAIRWTSRVRETGDIRPLRVGGDKRSARIEAFAPVILEAVEAKPDVTLAELRELLCEHRASFALSTIWRFFARHKITLKKVSPCSGAGSSRRPCAASRVVRRASGPRSRTPDLYRRTEGRRPAAKPAPAPRWRVYMVELLAGAGSEPQPHWPSGGPSSFSLGGYGGSCVSAETSCRWTDSTSNRRIVAEPPSQPHWA